MTCDFKRKRMIVVLGLGQMGRVAALALAKLGNKVIALDKDRELVAKCQEDFDKTGKEGQHRKIECGYVTGGHPNYTLSQLKEKPCCVLSCLPYFCDKEVAEYCINSEIPFANLGGDPPVETEIKALAANAKAHVFLSLGLAPGLVNIITEHLIKRHGVPEEVFMYVGGLPQDLHHGLYQRTWSTEGLYNEYKKACQVLENGNIKTVDALSGYVSLDNTYESFYTSGGISHSLERLQALGVKNASYNTIRYKGHREQILPLVTKLDKEECIRIFEKIFPTTQQDHVLMKIEMYYWDVGTVKIEYNSNWYSDYAASALAKTTAYPAAAIVHMMANNNFAHIDQKLLDYSMIEFSSFTGHLSRLGIFA